MTKDFKELILKNPGLEFVVHIKNKQELDELVDTLEELGFEYAVPLGTIREMAESFSREDGYDGCWRISRERGVAYNPSVEHWKFFTNDIVELQNGEIVFHEGYSTRADAELEKAKLRKAFSDPDDGEVNRRLFGLENCSAEEIERWLAEKFGGYTNEKA